MSEKDSEPPCGDAPRGSLPWGTTSGCSMTTGSPSATFVRRAASTMLRLRTANTAFPKADTHEAVLVAFDTATCTVVGDAQKAPIANAAFGLGLAIHRAAAPRVNADAGR